MVLLLLLVQVMARREASGTVCKSSALVGNRLEPLTPFLIHVL